MAKTAEKDVGQGFDKGKAAGSYGPGRHIPDRVALLNRETGVVSLHHVVDSQEILAAPGTIYEPAPPAAQQGGPSS